MCLAESREGSRAGRGSGLPPTIRHLASSWRPSVTQRQGTDLSESAIPASRSRLSAAAGMYYTVYTQGITHGFNRNMNVGAQPLRLRGRGLAPCAMRRSAGAGRATASPWGRSTTLLRQRGDCRAPSPALASLAAHNGSIRFQWSSRNIFRSILVSSKSANVPKCAICEQTLGI